MQGKLKYTNNPNFIFYTPIAPLARHRLRNVFLTHFPLHTRLTVEFSFLKKKVILKFFILFSITFFLRLISLLLFFSLPFLRIP
jgi:hypothetical protein